MANGALLTSGWSDAYEVDFTQGGGKGDRPIVLSYDSSPAFTVPEGSDTSTTSALLDTCFRQVEYAGVLRGAKNVAGAEAFVRFLVGPQVQAALPESMYVFPVAAGTELPPSGRRTPGSRASRTPSTPPRSPRTATTGCASGTSPPGDRHDPVLATIHHAPGGGVRPCGGRACRPAVGFALAAAAFVLSAVALLFPVVEPVETTTRSPASPWCRSSCWASSSCSR